MALEMDFRRNSCHLIRQNSWNSLYFSLLQGTCSRDKFALDCVLLRIRLPYRYG